MYTTGAQYEDVFPLLNWTTLPGTTEVQNAAQDREPPEHECGTIRAGTLHRPFVGGLSEGGMGQSPAVRQASVQRSKDRERLIRLVP